VTFLRDLLKIAHDYVKIRVFVDFDLAMSKSAIPWQKLKLLGEMSHDYAIFDRIRTRLTL
jgi:hypothetical protein